MIHARSATAALAVAAVAALGACKKSEYASDTAAARRDSAAGAMADTMHRDTLNRDTTKMARGGWSPASVVGYTVAVDSGEVQLGRLAEKKAKNPAVKAFAREMVTDHSAMLKGDHSLGTKLSTKWDSTADNVGDVLNHTRDEIKDLTDKAAGADWDGDYIDKMIDDHQSALDKLQDAAKNTTDANVRAALEKATGKVQEHLTKAQDIKNNKLKKS